MFVCALVKCKCHLWCWSSLVTQLCHCSPPVGPVWKLPAMRNGHSSPTHLCSDICLSFDLWSAAKQSQWLQLLRRARFVVPSLWGRHSGYEMCSVYHARWLIMSVTPRPLPPVHYVKQQCLKMELPYPLALQIVQQAYNLFGYQTWFQMSSALAPSPSAPRSHQAITPAVGKRWGRGKGSEIGQCTRPTSC